jgi:hypothetical protein
MNGLAVGSSRAKVSRPEGDYSAMEMTAHFSALNWKSTHVWVIEVFEDSIRSVVGVRFTFSKYLRAEQ